MVNMKLTPNEMGLLAFYQNIPNYTQMSGLSDREFYIKLYNLRKMLSTYQVEHRSIVEDKLKDDLNKIIWNI